MTYVAEENLKAGNGAIVYGVGVEVPEGALSTEIGKANGWKDKVRELKTKTVRATGPGTDKPVDAVDAPLGTANK